MKKKILLPILTFAILLTAIAVIFSNIKNKNRKTTKKFQIWDIDHKISR